MFRRVHQASSEIDGVAELKPQTVYPALKKTGDNIPYHLEVPSILPAQMVANAIVELIKHAMFI